MPVQRLKSLGEWEKEKKSPGLLVLKFTAAWCGPCKTIAPVYEELSEQHPDAKFLEVDADEVPEVADAYKVKGIPNFKFFVDGELIDEVQGANSDALRDKVTKLAAEHMKKHTIDWNSAPAPSAPPSLTADQRAKMEDFKAITAANSDQAYHYLKKHGFNTEMAMSEFFDAGGAEGCPPVPKLFDQPSPWTAPPPQPTLTRQVSGGDKAKAAKPIWDGKEDEAKTVLQFRLGQQKVTQSFPENVSVARVAEFVAELLPVGATFSLSTRQKLKNSPLDYTKTLKESGLTPRGLVLIDSDATELRV